MRTLNAEEAAIVSKKEKRMGRRLDVVGVEYRKAFPRSTVCLLEKGEGGDNQQSYSNMVLGVTMRGKKEPDIESIGNVQSFIRALNSI